MEVEGELQKAFRTERNFLLRDKPRIDSNETFKWSLIASFSTQHVQIKSIFRKHWDVLKKDKILDPLLPDQGDIQGGVHLYKAKLHPISLTPR